ncbi:MAG: outer membrane protein assembly factor BamD [Gallionella sp.]|jgi:outer membrane protein assembly factor BamD|nr:outer membrane protein assembly factor BamD [Gallionella sp.]
MRHSLAVFLLLTLIGCSSSSALLEGEDESKQKSQTAEEIYKEAKAKLDEKTYDAAIKKYESLQSRYPYGRYAQQSLLEMAYAYYKQGEPDPAIAAADRFIKQYPNNPHVDYAYYLKGLASFSGDMGVVDTIGNEDAADRDPQLGQDSFNAFKELVTRFPDSQYTPDAKLRMHYLVNQLARHDLHIAKYYLRRGANLAALNRAQDIIKQYPHSPSTREALLVMVLAYDAMGMTSLRDDTQRVLEQNGGTEAATAQAIAASKRTWWQFWK